MKRACNNKIGICFLEKSIFLLTVVIQIWMDMLKIP